MHRTWTGLWAGLALTLAAIASAGAQQPAAEFYKDKTISILIGTEFLAPCPHSCSTTSPATLSLGSSRGGPTSMAFRNFNQKRGWAGG